MESFRETSQAFWNYVKILQRKIHWVRSNISLHFNLHGIGSSSPLQIFLRFCCLIQEKRIVAYASLVFLKKFLYISTFSAGFKSNNLSYCAPSSSVLFTVFIIVLPPYLQYIAFSLIPAPLSSIATIFSIVSNPEVISSCCHVMYNQFLHLEKDSKAICWPYSRRHLGSSKARALRVSMKQSSCNGFCVSSQLQTQIPSQTKFRTSPK